MKPLLATALLLLAGCQPAVTYKNNHVEHLDKSFFDFMSMRYSSDLIWQDQQDTAGKVPMTKLMPHQLDGTNQLTFIGHSTFLLQLDGKNILTDPVFSDYSSPVQFAGPKRFTPPAIQINQLPRIDAVVISHNHYDHLDERSIEQLGNSTRYYVPMGLKHWFVNLGIDDSLVTELAWHQSVQVDGVRITATPSQHWSARTLFDRNTSHWASWLIDVGEHRAWFAGDTGYNDKDFKQIGANYPGIDVAMIPIGAYSPRSFMKLHHVNPEEALMMHSDIGAALSVGMHWGAFPLTAEPVAEPPQRLATLMLQNKAAAPFKALAIGEQIGL